MTVCVRDSFRPESQRRQNEPPHEAPRTISEPFSEPVSTPRGRASAEPGCLKPRLAKPGGFLDRKHDGEPGWQSIWPAYAKLHANIEGIKRIKPD